MADRRFAPRWVLVALVALAMTASAMGAERRFYPDDPVWRDLSPLPVEAVSKRQVNGLYDFLKHSVRADSRKPGQAGAVNTLGEVPDSAWFTNRHARRRMSLEELRRGPGAGQAPVAPFEVVGAKTDGITPGFRMRDAHGRLYFVKPDPMSNPEMATAADAIGARFFHALGYNTPENYIVNLRRGEIAVKPGTRTSAGGRAGRLRESGLDRILHNVPRRRDGTYRMIASLALPGNPVGPFLYEGTRSDDPNDVVPHQDRRDLRGLHVLAAWLNHTDAKAQNTLDTIVEENGVRFLRHHLIDFGSTLGSDSDMPKNARFGNEYVLPDGRSALAGIFGFGLHSPPWERTAYPDLDAVGRIEAERFDPDRWRSNYPNQAFLSRQPEDEYWAARLVMAFTDDDIAAVVAAGEFSDPRAAEYLARTLAARRDRIGRTYFARIAPLEEFDAIGGTLRFADLAVRHGFAPARKYQVSWSRFDNAAGTHTPIPGATGLAVPDTQPGSYLAARVQPAGMTQAVTVYLRDRRVVGIDR